MSLQTGETLEQVAHRGCGCPLHGSIQGQAGWDFGQPGPVVRSPAHGRGLELDDLEGPFQPGHSMTSGMGVSVHPSAHSNGGAGGDVSCLTSWE